MIPRKYRFLVPIILGTLLVGSVFLLWPAAEANAQCGSQASSCKNCHEVQGEDPVNGDGTDWHQPHAFGDFCEFCHAGNVQSTDKAEAHTGMVAPLSDVEAACSTCHGDYMELAQGYASTLGVEIGAGGGGDEAAGSDSPQPELISAEAAPANDASTNLGTAIYEEEDIIDYTRQYEETVLGIRDLNKGNLILAAIAAFMLLGGGAFVAINENWVHVTTKPVPESVDGFAPDNVALLPQLEKLDTDGRKGLHKLLKKPQKAARLFKAVADIED